MARPISAHTMPLARFVTPDDAPARTRIVLFGAGDRGSLGAPDACVAGSEYLRSLGLGEDEELGYQESEARNGES